VLNPQIAVCEATCSGLVCRSHNWPADKLFCSFLSDFFCCQPICSPGSLNALLTQRTANIAQLKLTFQFESTQLHVVQIAACFSCCELGCVFLQGALFCTVVLFTFLFAEFAWQSRCFIPFLLFKGNHMKSKISLFHLAAHIL